MTPHIYREYVGKGASGRAETTLKPLGDSLSYATGPSLDDRSPGGQSSPAARYTRLSTQARKVGTNWYANDARAVVRDATTECAGETFAVLVGRSRHTMAAAMDALEAAGVVNDTAVNPYGLSSPGGDDDGVERTHAVVLANAGPRPNRVDAYARSPLPGSRDSRRETRRVRPVSRHRLDRPRPPPGRVPRGWTDREGASGRAGFGAAVAAVGENRKRV